MKKIVRGNDFGMKIPVRKMVGKEQVKFALPACTDIVVNLVGAYRRHSLEYAISVGDDSVIEARVEGDALSVGNYALEVKGRLYGNDWRSNEYEQVQIVDNNAQGDTVFEPSEGEDSVEMDTAVVVLPPTADTEALIAACKEATEACRKTTAEAEAAESGRKAAEEARETAESERVKAEQKRQEDTDRAVKHAESMDVSLSGAEIVVSID